MNRRTIGLVVLMAAGMTSAVDFSSWQKSMQITFSGYSKAESLTNFPALVVLSTNISGFSYTNFLSGTNADLRFADATQTNELSYEIDQWQTNGSSYVWVRVPLLTNNASVWVYWGKTGQTASAYTTNGATWTNSYIGVWHLGQTNSSGAFPDSTSYGRGATNGTGNAGATSTSGIIDGGQAFNTANNPTVTVPYAPAFDLTGNFTIGGWFKNGYVPSSSYRTLTAKDTGAATRNWWLAIFSDGLLHWRDSTNNVQRVPELTSANTVTDGVWHAYAAVNAGTVATLYIDGVQSCRSNFTGNVSTQNAVVCIGYQASVSGRSFNGSLDEFSIANVPRSTNWIWASWLNQASNGVFAGSFNTYGAVATLSFSLPQVSAVGSQNLSNTSGDVVGRLGAVGGSADAVSLYWSTTDGTNNASAWTTGGSVSNLGAMANGTTFTNTLTGLASNTIYYWNYSANNSSGTAWAATAGSPWFKTFGPPAVNNGAGATAVLSTGATLNGNLTNGTTAHVYILLGPQDGVWTATNDLLTISEGAFSKTVSGLARGTTNYYTCYVTNAYGVALATPSVVFTTLQNSANTWTGGGTNSNASEAANWSGGVPTSGDSIVLNIATNKNMTWNAGSNGLPNTVAAWLQTADYTGSVTFRTYYPGQGTFTNFTIAGNCVISNGFWTHLANTSSETNRLCVTVGGNLYITNATISADGLGYSNSSGTGGPGGTVYPNGAAYGGVGGGGVTNVYGSVVAPTNLGSSCSTHAGGGAILLTVAGTTTVASAGTISANGAYNSDAWTGSGGSVFLTTGWLAGNGTLRANGGDGNNGGNFAGSGGRVAIILTGANADFSSWSGANVAYTGNNGGWQNPGAAGTVYLKRANGVDTLIIDNNNAFSSLAISTLMPGGVTLGSFSNVVIRGKGVLPAKNDPTLGSCANWTITSGGTLAVQGNTALDFNTFAPTTYGPANSYIEIASDSNVTYPASWTVNNYTLLGEGITKTLANVTVGTNGAISHSANTSLNLTLSGNLTVLSNGTIQANGMATGGPGAASYPNGACYGGQASGSATPTSMYGSILSPTNLGSGAASAGGGKIRLTVAGTTTVYPAGTISANAIAADYTGSGGSVYLTTGWLASNGTISANGGSANNGAGSGGRVAIVLTGAGADFSSWGGANVAYGNASVNYVPSAAGTVYRATAGIPAGAGTVTVDNGNLTSTRITPLPAFATSTENLTNTQWLAQNRGKIGLVTNTTIASLNLNTNGFLELNGYTLTVKGLTVTNKVYKSGIYGPHDTPISALTDSGSNGKVIVNVGQRGTVLLLM